MSCVPCEGELCVWRWLCGERESLGVPGLLSPSGLQRYSWYAEDSRSRFLPEKPFHTDGRRSAVTLRVQLPSALQACSIPPRWNLLPRLQGSIAGCQAWETPAGCQAWETPAGCQAWETPAGFGCIKSSVQGNVWSSGLKFVYSVNFLFLVLLKCCISKKWPYIFY